MAMNEILCSPVSFTIADAGGATNAANLATERLGRVASFPNQTYVIVDVGSQLALDTFAILAGNGTAAVHFQVRGYGSLVAAQNKSGQTIDTGVISSIASTDALRRLHRQGVAYTPPGAGFARFYRLDVDGAINIGRLVLGTRYVASDTMDMGYTYKVIDLGAYQQSQTKLDNSITRGKTLEFSWTWSWLSQNEARGALLDLMAYAGITRDILCVLNPDAPDLHNVIGYGKFVEFPEPTNVVSGGPDLANAFKVDLRLQSRLLLSL